MNTLNAKWLRRILPAAIGLALGATSLAGTAAHADEHRGPHRDIGGIHHSRHWVFDDRYHHAHYYPAVGYSIGVLPPGYLSIGFGSRHFYFQGGVWFAPAGPNFVVVRPPVGVVVPMLPPTYTTVWVSGAPYYYANDIYYVASPGGYTVVAPPTDTTYVPAPAVSAPGPAATTAPAPPPPPGSPTAGSPGQPTAGVWYYCEAVKGYYPYVTECKSGWKTVPATPPGGH